MSVLLKNKVSKLLELLNNLKNQMIMRTRFLTLLVFFVILSPTLVLAHAGHGTFDGINLWHYLTSPLHLISTTLVLAATVFGVRYFKRKQTN